MDEIISQILDIEEKAQKIVSDAKKAQSELEGRVERDSAKLKSDIEASMNEKNASINKTEGDEADRKISAIDADANKKIAALDKKYRQNREVWVNNIVSGVVGEEK